jgi:hypothetical protein
MTIAVMHTLAALLYTPTFCTTSADRNHNFLSFLRSFPNAVMMRKVDHKRQKVQEDPVVLAD